MGTITSRKGKSGVRHTAQIRLKKGGRVVYTESATFERKQAAQAWLKRRETELAEPGAIEQALRPKPTIREIIQTYLDHNHAVPLKRSKKATLTRIAASWLGDIESQDLNSQTLVDYVTWRMEKEGVTGATAHNDVSHLAGVLSIAEPGWGFKVDLDQVTAARRVLKKLSVRSKAEERDRRPTLAELDLLMTHFAAGMERYRARINMVKLTAFAIFSARRQAEICRIRWDDLDKAGGRVLVRDMKNPGRTVGNNVWCVLTPQAMRIIDSMPRDHDEIFPYNPASVSSAWTKACAILGIEDLHFHDLRHEGISRLFEMGWDIPRVASVSGHRTWQTLARYTHLDKDGDKYEGWPWLEAAIQSPVFIGDRVRLFKTDRLKGGVSRNPNGGRKGPPAAPLGRSRIRTL